MRDLIDFFIALIIGSCLGFFGHQIASANSFEYSYSQTEEKTSMIQVAKYNYSLNKGPTELSFNANYTKNHYGRSYLFNGMIDIDLSKKWSMFYFGTYEDNSIVDLYRTDWGLGAGYYLIKEKDTGLKLSYALVKRSEDYINSWRIKVSKNIDSLVFSYIYYYLVPLREIRESVLITYPLSAGISIGFQSENIHLDHKSSHALTSYLKFNL